MPRCPRCTYLTLTPGVCAVCQSGVPVHRVTDAEMAAALARARQAIPCAPTGRSVTRVQSASVLTVETLGLLRLQSAPPDTRHTRREYPCETPGCPGIRYSTAQAVGRLRRLNQALLCEACSAEHKRRYQRVYQRVRAQRLRQEVQTRGEAHD